MFFANPVPAMRNIRATMRPGGLLTMVVWRQKADNVFMYEAEQITERFLTHPGPDRRADLRPGPVLDGERRHDDRDHGRGRLRGRDADPLRLLDVAGRHDRARRSTW